MLLTKQRDVLLPNFTGESSIGRDVFGLGPGPLHDEIHETETGLFAFFNCLKEERPELFVVVRR